MGKVAVICCVYNTEALARQCLNALLEQSSDNVHVFLVDNHGPSGTEWLKDALTAWQFDDVTLLDPGKNLGCHNGWNYGYAEAAKNPEFTHFVKLDDDTIVQTKDWDKLMVAGLDAWPELGYLSADIDAKQALQYSIVEKGGFKYEIPPKMSPGGMFVGTVGFSCVMFRRAQIEAWGPMKSAFFHAPQKGHETLYGGEEVHYANKANACLMPIAHFPAVFCHHLGNEERHPDYPMWKWIHGFAGWTPLGMEELAANKPLMRQMICKRLQLEMQQKPPNDHHVSYCVRRLRDAYGDEQDKYHLANVAWVGPLTRQELTKYEGIDWLMVFQAMRVQ